MERDKKTEIRILHKCIELVQSCITRMAYSSMLTKLFAIVILSVLLSLGNRGHNLEVGILGVVAIMYFWYLDSFFLHIEDLYRKMYSGVIKKKCPLDIELVYDLNPHRFENYGRSRISIFFSETLMTFYGIPLLVALSIICVELL
jgi:hypothetical protein